MLPPSGVVKICGSPTTVAAQKNEKGSYVGVSDHNRHTLSAQAVSSTLLCGGKASEHAEGVGENPLQTHGSCFCLGRQDMEITPRGCGR
jgi:hypothetical protein